MNILAPESKPYIANKTQPIKEKNPQLMAILLTVFLCIVFFAVVDILSNTHYKTPPPVEGENGLSVSKEEHFIIEKLFKNGVFQEMRIGSPYNDFVLWAKRPIDPEDDELEFYKIYTDSEEKWERLSYRSPRINTQGLTRYMKNVLNACADFPEPKSVKPFKVEGEDVIMMSN